MKKMMKLFVPVTAAVVALASCNQEIEQNIQPAEGMTIRVHASANDLKADDPETRTYIATYQGRDNTILWGTGEYMKLALASGEVTDANTAFGTSSEDSADAWNGENEADFAFTITPKDANADAFTLMGLYPASAAVASSNTNPASYKVNLPSTQNATASSYDPAAYIMVAKPESFDAVQTDWVASFRRATALNKITLKNIPEDVVSVEFTAPNEKYLAGRRHVDLTTGSSDTIYEGATSLKVNYNTPSAGTVIKTVNCKDVWFTSWGVELEEGASFTIVAKSATKSYTRALTVNAKGLSFKEGYLNTLNVDMASAEVEDLIDYSGFYLIGYKPSGAWILMDPEYGSNAYYPGYTSTVTKAVADVDFATDFAGVSGINDYIWKVEKYDGAYSIKSMKSSKYLALTANSNNAHHADEQGENTKFTIGISNKVATIESTAFSGRVLKYNSSSPRFAFYASGQNDICLIPATYDDRDAVTLSFAESSISKTTANYSEFTGQAATAAPNESAITSNISYELTGDNIGSITSGYTVSLNGNTGTATVTASFAGDETYRPATASYTITVSDAGGPEYVLVSAANDVVAGDYIITWDNSYYLPSGSTSGTNPAVGTGITVANNKITNTVTSDMVWTFTGDNTNGFTISDGTNILHSTNTAQGISITTNSTRKWTASVDGTYGMLLRGDDGGTRNLAVYNSGSWRYYATGNSYSGILRLYKLDNSNVTPTVATPTFSFIPSGNKVSISCATDGATIYYTTNGDDPTTLSNEYSEAISLSGDQMTIKAFATKSSYDVSAIASTTYYAINRAATTNGSISAVDYAAEGDEITITVTPDSGYSLETLSVTDSGSNAVPVSNNQFTMPASPVTVSATFAQIQATTIANALAAPGTYEVPNVAVYAVKGNALILGDATGKIYAFKSSHGLTVGDVRTVSGSTIWYNSGDVYEFDSPTFSGSGTTSINHGTAVEFAENAATLQTETGFVSTGSGAAHTAVYVHAIGDQSGRSITTSNGKVLYLSATETATDGMTVEVYGYVYAYSASHTNFNFLVTSIEEYVDPNAKSITALKSSITGVSANGVNNASESGVYSLTNASDSDVTVTPDGTIVTAASISGGALTYTVAANNSSARSGSVTLAVAGGNSINVTISQLAGAGSTTQYYTLVTDLGTLSANDKILIINTNHDALPAFTGTGTISPTDLHTSKYDSSNDRFPTNDATVDNCAITLVAPTTPVNGKVVFKLKMSNNYFIVKTGTSGTGFNPATTSSAVSGDWTLTMDNQGRVEIKHNLASATRGLVWRTGTVNKFAAYALSNVNNTEYYNVYIYKLN